MGFEIRMDKDWEQKLAQEAQREVQRFFDSFGRRNAGRPVDAVKSALRSEWRQKMDGSMSESELQEYAKHISAGTTIKVRGA